MNITIKNAEDGTRAGERLREVVLKNLARDIKKATRQLLKLKPGEKKVIRTIPVMITISRSKEP